MSELKINFEYNSNKITLQCKREDKMNDLLEKLKIKIILRQIRYIYYIMVIK